MKSVITFAFLSLALMGYPQTQTPNQLEKQIFDNINKLRSERGIPALQWNKTLFNLAKEHSEYQAEKGCVSHDNFIVRVKSVGQLSENVAMNVTIDGVINNWLASKNHKENMLSGGQTGAIALAQVDDNIFVTFLKK